MPRRELLDRKVMAKFETWDSCLRALVAVASILKHGNFIPVR